MKLVLYFYHFLHLSYVLLWVFLDKDLDSYYCNRWVFIDR